MNTSPTEPQGIATILPELMRRIGAIGKDRTNQHQRYNFRGIDDVLNHVGPSCAELGIRVSVTIHDFSTTEKEWEEEYRGETKQKFRVRSTLRLRIEFFAPDGTSHVAESIGDAMDTNGDKATNKAMSAAFKYACFMGLVIPVEGALDDSDSDDKQPTASKSTVKPAAKKKAAPAYDETINEDCKKWEDWKTQKGTTLAEMKASDKMDAKGKVEILKKIKAQVQALAEKADNEVKAKLLFADVAFIEKGIAEISNEPF